MATVGCLPASWAFIYAISSAPAVWCAVRTPAGSWRVRRPIQSSYSFLPPYFSVRLPPAGLSMTSARSPPGISLFPGLPGLFFGITLLPSSRLASGGIATRPSAFSLVRYLLLYMAATRSLLAISPFCLVRSRASECTQPCSFALRCCGASRGWAVEWATTSSRTAKTHHFAHSPRLAYPVDRPLSHRLSGTSISHRVSHLQPLLSSGIAWLWEMRSSWRWFATHQNLPWPHAPHLQMTVPLSRGQDAPTALHHIPLIRPPLQLLEYIVMSVVLSCLVRGNRGGCLPRHGLHNRHQQPNSITRQQIYKGGYGGALYIYCCLQQVGPPFLPCNVRPSLPY